jgi:hypothetical protein
LTFSSIGGYLLDSALTTETYKGVTCGTFTYADRDTGLAGDGAHLNFLNLLIEIPTWVTGWCGYTCDGGLP